MTTKIRGYCAFNRGEVPDIDNMSFEKTKSGAERLWKGQEIRKCEVIIHGEKLKKVV